MHEDDRRREEKRTRDLGRDGMSGVFFLGFELKWFGNGKGTHEMGRNGSAEKIKD